MADEISIEPLDVVLTAVNRISLKSILAYHLGHNSLLLREWFNPNRYEPAIFVHCELSLDRPFLKKLTEQEIKELEDELKDTDEERCRTATLESGIWEKEKVQDVYPPQIQVGCYEWKEFKVMLQKPSG